MILKVRVLFSTARASSSSALSLVTSTSAPGAGAAGGSGLRFLPLRRPDPARDPPAFRHAFLLLRDVEDFLLQRIAEHPRELRLAGLVDEDLDPPFFERRAKRRDARIAEHQPVEPDVGVEDQLQTSTASSGTLPFSM
jgi:hypothetical protein